MVFVNKTILLCALSAMIILAPAVVLAQAYEIDLQAVSINMPASLTVGGKTMLQGIVNEKAMTSAATNVPDYEVSFYYKAVPTSSFGLPFGLGKFISPIMDALSPAANKQTGSMPATEQDHMTLLCTAKVAAHSITGTKQQTVSCDATILAAGKYDVTMSVSGANIKDPVTSNNVKSKQITVTAGSAKNLPDLGIKSISVTPKSPAPGKTMTVKVTVQNTGKSTVTFTPNMFRPEVPWLCTQLQTCYDTGCSKIVGAKCNQWTTGAEAHCTCGLNALKTAKMLGPGASTEIVFTLAAPQKAGSYMLYIRLDPENTLAEASKSNNVKSANINVVGAAAATGGNNLKAGESSDLNGYTVKIDSIATASGGAADAFITVCKMDECSASTGFKKDDTKELKADGKLVTIKLSDVAYGASVKVKFVSDKDAPSGGGSSGTPCTTLKATESADINGATITADSIATASGGSADAFITTCKGNSCTASTGFKKGNVKALNTGAGWWNVTVVDVAYGSSVCLTAVVS